MIQNILFIIVTFTCIIAYYKWYTWRKRYNEMNWERDYWVEEYKRLRTGEVLGYDEISPPPLDIKSLRYLGVPGSKKFLDIHVLSTKRHKDEFFQSPNVKRKY